MSRSDRLFRLLEALRRLPSPVKGAHLASETGVSIRSVYRDIETLRAGGADIRGERGLGYMLIDDGSLRPRTFSRIEIEALTLGLAQVKHIGDPALAAAAETVLGKVAATLPSLGQQHLMHAVSRVHRFGTEVQASNPGWQHMDLIRQSCWREEALEIGYTDREQVATQRTIWPLAVVYVDKILVLLARCCLRDDFRIFRVERMSSVKSACASFRPRRAGLLRAYLARLNETQERVIRR